VKANISQIEKSIQKEETANVTNDNFAGRTKYDKFVAKVASI
jgi:hypothetical protein